MARATTTRSAGTKRAAATKSRAKDIAAEADEFVEVKGSSGDFPRTWDFEEDGDLVGTFLGTVQKDIKGETRTLHNFEVDGEEVTAWGAAILDSRLDALEGGEGVKVVKTGDKIVTKSKRSAWEFKVFVRKGALRRAA